jgi:hypothetical protein
MNFASEFKNCLEAESESFIHPGGSLVIGSPDARSKDRETSISRSKNKDVIIINFVFREYGKSTA